MADQLALIPSSPSIRYRSNVRRDSLEPEVDDTSVRAVENVLFQG